METPLNAPDEPIVDLPLDLPPLESDLPDGSASRAAVLLNRNDSEHLYDACRISFAGYVEKTVEFVEAVYAREDRRAVPAEESRGWWPW
jgi:hypothetical protein